MPLEMAKMLHEDIAYMPSEAHLIKAAVDALSAARRLHHSPPRISKKALGFVSDLLLCCSHDGRVEIAAVALHYAAAQELSESTAASQPQKTVKKSARKKSAKKTSKKKVRIRQ